MKTDNLVNDQDISKNKGMPRHFRILFFVLEIVLIGGLLIWWLSSETIRQSKSLWVLFFYSFPAEFLIAIVPHEPMLLYFGKFYAPLTVAAVAILSTLMTEAINYSVFKFVTDLNFFQKIQSTKTISKIINLFRRAPFTAILVAGFSPVPFYPIRFLVVMSKYPTWKYLSGVFLARTPRFFLLALIGHEINIPDYLLVILFAALIASIYFPVLTNYLKKKRKNKNNHKTQKDET